MDQKCVDQVSETEPSVKEIGVHICSSSQNQVHMKISSLFTEPTLIFSTLDIYV